MYSAFFSSWAVKRDIAERGRDLKGVLQQYHSFVKPSFDTYIHPTMAHADGTFLESHSNSYFTERIG